MAAGEQIAVPASSSGPLVADITPPARITAPEYIDFHMISDFELSQLSKPETAVLGTVGWAAAGAAAGFALGAGRALVTVYRENKVTLGDLFSALFFVALAVIGIICLIMHFRNSSNLQTLTATIRSRKQHTR